MWTGAVTWAGLGGVVMQDTFSWAVMLGTFRWAVGKATLDRQSCRAPLVEQ